MSIRFRVLWSRLATVRSNVNFRPMISQCYQRRAIQLPCLFGFSLFTWLGFQKETSAEDDLIHTIKHCVLFIENGAFAKAEQLLHVALRQAQQMQHQLAITYIYDIMANLALERDQLDKAKQLFIAVSQRLMSDGATEDDFRIIHISAKLARISHLKKEYETAQLGYDWCLNKLKKIVKSDNSEEKIKLLALTEDWYGRLFIDSRQYEQALKLMTDSLKNMEVVKNLEKEQIVIQLNDIGTVCDMLEKSDESIEYFTKAIELGKPLEMDTLGTMYVNLGRAYLKKKLMEDARRNCGYGWKLASLAKNKEVKTEAEECLSQIKKRIR